MALHQKNIPHVALLLLFSPSFMLVMQVEDLGYTRGVHEFQHVNLHAAVVSVYKLGLQLIRSTFRVAV